MTETPDNMAEFEAEFDDDRGPCDADQFPGQSPSYVDGHCRCLVCAHCGHHTGNAHQGHFATACKVLMRRLREENPDKKWGLGEWVNAVQREPHMCCPDEHGCELKEEWRAVPGYEGLYEVSDKGFVRSLPRPRTPGKTLRPTLGGSGSLQYKQVVLSKDGEVKTWKVHQLVLLAFVGPMPEGQVSRHGPGGHLNNCLSNLCYGTPAENNEDQFIHGTRNRAEPRVKSEDPYASRRGEGNHSALLTQVIVDECRRRHEAGEKIASLAREFKVSYNTMWFAVRGITWK